MCKKNFFVNKSLMKCEYILWGAKVNGNHNLDGHCNQELIPNGFDYNRIELVD